MYNLAMFTRKTKIVCSIGPASDDDWTIRSLILAGMNVARFNFSHGEHEWHKQAMDRVKRIAAELGQIVAILLDTKGPEIRTGMVKGGKNIDVATGDKFVVVADKSECYGCLKGKPGNISLSWQELATRIKPGVHILIADGLIELSVDSVKNGKVFCTACNDGSFGSKKNVNLVGIHAGLPIMAEQDKKDIAFGVEQNIDFVAASFVSFPEEVAEIREYLTSLGSKAHIIAKIENEEGLKNIDGIIEKADGIMVARGDLGVQVPTERIPIAQKKIISRCREAGKPVITATQMLDSMIVNPRPTRAELTDVANAIFDGTDAIMLSGETASGKYPVEAVKTMDKIARTTEDSEEYVARMEEIDRAYKNDLNIGHIVARNAYQLATDIKAMAIVIPTMTGHTACMISRFRPEQTILAVTPDKQVCRQLMLNWGIVPILTKVVTDSETMVQNSVKMALDAGVVSLSDRVVMAAGIPLGSPLMVNTIKVILVGNVLVRGTESGYCNKSRPRASGRIVHPINLNDALNHVREDNNSIIVCKRLTKDYLPILHMVNGVVAEFGSDLTNDLLAQISDKLVWVTNVPAAYNSLEEGLSVTVDGEQGLVYEGIV